MKTLIVGIGSTILGDDGVGVVAAQRLKERIRREDVDIIEIGTAGLSLLDLVEGYDRLIILDAMVSGAQPGTVHLLRGEDMARTAHLHAGHEADLPTTLSLGAQLMDGRMPEQVVVVAVEAKEMTRFSESLSPEVESALPEVLARVERLLQG